MKVRATKDGILFYTDMRKIMIPYRVMKRPTAKQAVFIVALMLGE